jgi:succinate dehydrogenase flavin-adding protein (antitoxin of CptAB toxin-antitoxin module)
MTVNIAPKSVTHESELNPERNDDIWRKRLKFRCKNRGIKELDLLLGNWADVHLKDLATEEFTQLQTLLNEETLDLVSYFVKNEPMPDHLQNNSVSDKILSWRNAGNITGYNIPKT